MQEGSERELGYGGWGLGRCGGTCALILVVFGMFTFHAEPFFRTYILNGAVVPVGVAEYMIMLVVAQRCAAACWLVYSDAKEHERAGICVSGISIALRTGLMAPVCVACHFKIIQDE